MNKNLALVASHTFTLSLYSAKNIYSFPALSFKALSDANCESG